MNPDSFTEIKPHVGTGDKYQPATLCVGEHDGVMWASNRYWMTRASRVASLLEKFNLSAAVPGTYEVTASNVRPAPPISAVPFEPGKNLDPAAYTVALVPALLAGKQAYTRTDSGLYRAVYQTADCAFLGLAAYDLEWLGAAWSNETPEDCYHGSVRFLTTVPGKGNRAVGIIADLIRRVTPVTYEGRERHGGETENLGPRVIGIISSMTLEAGK
jgi:hypothetical protein